MNRTRFILIVAVILVAVALYRDRENKRQDAASVKEATVGVDNSAQNGTGVAAKKGHSAPSFALTGLDGKEYKVGGPRDKPLMVNFWASWCGPCEEEAPMLAALYEKYGDRFDLYGVNMTVTDSESKAKAFAEQYGFAFPVLLDKEGKAGDLYRIIGIPTSFLIGTDGKIADIFNVLDPEEMEERLASFIEAQESGG